MATQFGSAGSAVTGSNYGFSMYGDAGLSYRTFDTAFSSTPTVVLTSQNGAHAWGGANSIGTTSFGFRVAASGYPITVNLGFIAMN